MTNEQKTEAPERIYIWAQGIIRQLRQLGYLVPYPVMMKAIQANSDLAQPMCAAVKPLEWEDNFGLEARTEIGTYLVRETLDDKWEWIIALGDHSYYSSEDGLAFGSEGEACQSANSKHTRRISEALELRTVESVLQGVCYILTSSHEDPKLDYGCDTLRDDEDTYISVEWVKRVFERYTREAK